MIDRRSVLAAASASIALSALGLPARALAAAGLKLGKAQPFSFEALTQEMQARASQPYVREASLPEAVLDRIDYEAHGKLKFNTDYALFRDGPGLFPVTFFHLGKFFRTPVHMYVLSDEQSAAREILYDSDYFSMPADSPARQLPKGAGFAGFRFQESRAGDQSPLGTSPLPRLQSPLGTSPLPRLQSKLDWPGNDWVAFLGASYFRGIGSDYQYGLSARGVAINVASAGHPEEFPDFTRFYFLPKPDGQPPADDSNEVTVYAALEGPSITGAYRFVMRRDKAVEMEIEVRLFLRKDVSQLGIAPMTSMYWYSETAKPTATDWRPEVHDSDGLAMWSGTGEHIWRPLNANGHASTSAFADKAPKGFGLLQRDRIFDHYLDGVHYERRPSLWVEPLDDWGEGSVQLVELPTDDEFHDNIVAMWVPKQAATAGSHLQLRYRLYWAADEPHPTPLARCIATRLGRGGEPGKPRPPGVRKFVVEFLGGPLASLPFGTKPQPILTATSGTFSYVFTEAVPDGVPGHWRASFDFTAAGPGVVEMRLFLKSGEQTLSETWLYQYVAG